MKTLPQRLLARIETGDADELVPTNNYTTFPSQWFPGANKVGSQEDAWAGWLLFDAWLSLLCYLGF